MMYYYQYMARIKADAYKCERCGHVWLPRKATKIPKVCPKCKSPYWNEPRKQAKNSSKGHSIIMPDRKRGENGRQRT